MSSENNQIAGGEAKELKLLFRFDWKHTLHCTPDLQHASTEWKSISIQ